MKIEDLAVNSMTKWMLASLHIVLAHSAAIARAEPFNFASPTGDTNCKAPYLCVTARPERRLLNDEFPAKQVESPGLHKGFPPASGLHHATDSGGNENGISSPHPGSFACGEVVSGYTVNCMHRPTKVTVSAPEMDASGAAGGVVIVMGCLAVLHGRRRRHGTA